MEATNNQNDTIFALSSGTGVAGIAVVRISGHNVRDALRLTGGPLPAARQASLRRLIDPFNGELVDEALVLWFPAPKSVTGEDVLEFHVHGSTAVLDRLFTVLQRFEPFRMAEPGEFTRRAFENGRIDLIEMEGLADLLKAQTDIQRRQALFHKSGAVSHTYENWRRLLLDALVSYEAGIDFADESDVEDEIESQALPILIRLRDEMRRTLQDDRRGERIRSGLTVVLAGPPNTGKSSILNVLARREAAIVSAIPGTTRDAIEVHLDIAGMPVSFIDTAGLRDGSTDPIEREGIIRSRAWLARADLILEIFAPDSEEKRISGTDSVALRILNKVDLPAHGADEKDYHVCISARTGAGMDDFLQLLEEQIRAIVKPDEPALISRYRQRVALEEALSYLDAALDAKSAPVELQAESVRMAARSLARLTGRIDVEDILGGIFAEFCVGK